MSQNFQNGDFLVFQLESGFALLRLLAIDESGGEKVWHVAAYNEFFPDVDAAETASLTPAALTKSSAHVALTNRAFESTQVARIANLPLEPDDLEPLEAWRRAETREISDRSVRLMLGFR